MKGKVNRESFSNHRTNLWPNVTILRPPFKQGPNLQPFLTRTGLRESMKSVPSSKCQIVAIGGEKKLKKSVCTDVNGAGQCRIAAGDPAGAAQDACYLKRLSSLCYWGTMLT